MRNPATLLVPSLPCYTWRTVAVQGHAGNYAHQAAQTLCPNAEVRFYPTFEEAVAAVPQEAEGAVLPIENNTMGRVGDIHHLLPKMPLALVAELYQPIRHCLMVRPGVGWATLKTAHSQLPALAQCVETLKRLGLTPVSTLDTAGAAKSLAATGDETQAAIASALAAKLYGLEILQEGVNDQPENTTRFVALAPQAVLPAQCVPCKFSLMFGVDNRPGGLVESLQAFAQAGINLSKLESYDGTGRFNLTHFYVEGEGHPGTPVQPAPLAEALATLRQKAAWVKELGVYPQAPWPEHFEKA